MNQAISSDTSQSVQLGDAAVVSIGQASAWFEVRRDDQAVWISPREPLQRRCTIRPAALFQQDRGFPDVNMVLGRLVFARGATQPQRYVPYTLDPARRFRELFLPVEVMPEDEWAVSKTRWSNCQAIAKRLLHSAEVPWNGLAPNDVDDLVTYVPWPEPLEGCVLHALAQWTYGRGCCVIEIGSFRGRSLSMLAMALRGVRCPSKIMSIDPHKDQPHNQSLARIALRQLGEEGRLVQYVGDSAEAWRMIRPGSASLIFVDGEHSYERVVADFDQYRDLLADGGCMVFHDYGYGNHNGLSEADPDVRRAIDRHVFDSKEFRPLLLAHSQFAFVKGIV